MRDMVLVQCGEWVGLYVNGKLYDQHHDLPPDMYARAALDGDGKFSYKTGDLPDGAVFPENLSDVKGLRRG